MLQVNLYFPESGHEAYGIIRAVVRDSTDIDLGDASQVCTTTTSAFLPFTTSSILTTFTITTITGEVCDCASAEVIIYIS